MQLDALLQRSGAFAGKAERVCVRGLAFCAAWGDSFVAAAASPEAVAGGDGAAGGFFFNAGCRPTCRLQEYLRLN